MTVDEIGSRFGDELLDRWKSSHVTDADISYPNGETGREVVIRSLETMRRFSEQHHEFERIGSFHSWRRHSQGHASNPEGSRRRRPPHIAIPNGVVYRVEFERTSNTWRSPDL